MRRCCECNKVGIPLRVTDEGKEYCHDCWHGHDAEACEDICGWLQLPDPDDLDEAQRFYEEDKADLALMRAQEDGLL